MKEIKKLHLQWFAEEEEGLDFEETEDDFDLVAEEDEVEETGPSKEELIAKLKVAEENKSDPTNALVQGFEKLNQTLATPTQPQMKQQPGESEEAFKQRINAEFIDSPYNYMEEFMIKKIAPELNKLTNNLKVSKKFLSHDESRSGIYQKYKDEVEKEVQGIVNADPIKVTDVEVYFEAVDRVKAKHSDEIIDDIVEKKVAETLQKMGINVDEATSQPVFSINNQQPSGRTARTKKRVSKEQMAKIKSLMERKGMSQKDAYLALGGE